MQSRSVTRELALLILGQVSETTLKSLDSISLEELLNIALQSLIDHWREGLDNCAVKIETAQEHLLESELEDLNKISMDRIKGHLRDCLLESESILNGLSASLELPRLLALSDQHQIRLGALKRVALVLEKRNSIDTRLDAVMEGWRLKRLPRIDRDILRLAVVDLMDLKVPIAVACNEAVGLANRYSDDQGRRMINGILRRLQNSLHASTF